MGIIKKELGIRIEEEEREIPFVSDNQLLGRLQVGSNSLVDGEEELKRSEIGNGSHK